MNSTYMNTDSIKPKYIGSCNVCHTFWLIRNRKRICYCDCGRRLQFKKIQNKTKKA